MTQRIQLGSGTPEPYEPYRQLLRLHVLAEKAATDAGVDPRLLELVKCRASMLNGCSSCLDMHAEQARKHGETDQRLLMLSVWREAEDLYDARERAALALTDAITRLSHTQDVPDDVYAQAAAVFTEDQYRAVAWAATIINAFNRLNVTSRKPLPAQAR